MNRKSYRLQTLEFCVNVVNFEVEDQSLPQRLAERLRYGAMLRIEDGQLELGLLPGSQAYVPL